MNQESRRAGSSVTLHSCDYRQSGSGSWVPGFLIVISVCLALGITSQLVAGDAVAIGYNADGIWTDVTYYRSATRKGGKDYRTSDQAREFALRDVRRRSQSAIATTHILSASDSTGFVAVARGQDQSGKDFHAVGRGKSQIGADKKALSELNEAGAAAEQKIIYRYFSHGSDSK